MSSAKIKWPEFAKFRPLFHKNMNQTKKLNNIVIHSKFKPAQLIHARMGLRTNGDLHIGNLFPIVTGFLLGSSLIKQGYHFEFSIYLVDQEINFSKKPFHQISGKNGHTLADRSISIIKHFVNELHLLMPEIKIVYRKVSKTQRMKKFRILLRQILESEVYKINLECLCPKHKISIKFEYLKGKISFSCNRCRKKYFYNLFDKKLELMLDHDILGVIEDNLFPMDIHIIGRDHAIVTKKNDSALEFRDKLQKVLRVSKHITLLTPLVLGKDKKKMSKSERTGLFLSQIRNENYSIQNIVDFVSKNINKKTIEVSKFM